MITVEFLCDKFANTYLVSNGQEIIIIDPAVELRSARQMIDKYFANQKVIGIVLTHGHYDHFLFLNKIANAFKVPVYLSKNDFPKLNDLSASCANLFGIQKMKPFTGPVSFLREGKMQIGSFELTIIFTPGHTNGSVSVIIGDSLFTGDTLFFDGVGRTDLPTGNAVMLNESINRLMHLKEDYQVYPGHGKSTTIDFERRHNYYYQKIKK